MNNVILSNIYSFPGHVLKGGNKVPFMDKKKPQMPGYTFRFSIARLGFGSRGNGRNSPADRRRGGRAAQDVFDVGPLMISELLSLVQIKALICINDSYLHTTHIQHDKSRHNQGG